MFAAWATSVGTNVDVSGTLTVSGNTTLNGNQTFGNAAGDTNIFTGTLQASTTALFTGDITTYGAGTFGDTAADNYRFVGGLQATSTLGVTGITFLYGDVRINGFATTTAASGNTLLNGTLGVGTTTISGGADLNVHSSATTTLSIGSAGGANVGGCIELKGLDGVKYKIFASATTSVTKQLIVEVGNCDKVDGGN